jgi:uncharacterized protein YkwD
MLAHLVTLTTLALAAGPFDDVPAEYALMHPVEVQIAEETNRERVRHGLKPLRVDWQLVISARRHTSWMATNHALQHTSDAVAENIARGQRSAAGAVSAWMNSRGHRANLLNSSNRRLGVAAYVASDGTIYWCQQFLP